MTERNSVREMWAAFLLSRPNTASPAASYSVWHFGDNETLADSLVELVLSGRKRATAEALWSYEFEKMPVPQAGEFSIVTDWKGKARFVIQTTAIEILPFMEVTHEFASAEGEGDASLEYWRKVHWSYFTRVLESCGREPRADMPVACERFKVVFRADSVQSTSDEVEPGRS